MAFPNNPSNGDTFVRYGRTYQYDSTMLMWKVLKSGILLEELADIDITTNPPTAGDALLWSGSTFEPGTVGAVKVYQTNLPLSGNSAGDIAYVTDLSRLYMFTGVGWFNIALINTNPTITTGPEGSYTFALDGTPIVITLEAADPEGLPITWSYSVTSGVLGSTATLSQAGNVFTLTPSTNSGDSGEFSITFTASDGINLATAASSFTLSFSLAVYNSTKDVSDTEIGLTIPSTVWFDVADEYDITVNQNLVVDIDIWGGAGGGGSIWSGAITNGGAGGYSYARGLQLPAGTYKVVVGAGGLGAIFDNAETQVTMDSLNEDFGNGGLGSQGNYSGAGDNNGGCAGGFSGLFSTSVAFANTLFMSGGGGGAGTGAGNHGGQGGVTSGANGVSGGAYFGRGGTQLAGGIGAGGTDPGEAGSQMQGGNGGVRVGVGGFGGGGGGGGYYGGGASGTNSNSGMGGGGGGSGYITGALTMTSSGEETATAKRTPTTTATGAPNNTSPGVGGFSGASRPGVNGFDGAVKITITATY